MQDTKISNILSAARKRFAHYGIAKTTMSEIAADIGMSKASLYYYFPDKERIFIAVVEQEVGEFLTMIEELIARPSKPAFKLKKYLSLRNQMLDNLGNLAKVENPNPADYFNPLFDELKARNFKNEKALIERIFQMGIDENYFIKFRVDEYADFFLNTLRGLRMNILANRQGDDTSQKAAEHASLFLQIFLQSISG